MRACKPDLRALACPELEGVLRRLGEKPYRARQLFRWLHRRGAGSLDEMTDLPRDLRARLSQDHDLLTLTTADERRSSDGTIKWKWRTFDGRFIESVYMPQSPEEEEWTAAEPAAGSRQRASAPKAQPPAQRERRTLCVSSQVGCAIGCTFCMTGTMGLSRSLGPGEMVDQVHRANRRLVELGEGAAPRPITNVVFMGMGEPLHDFESLKAALALLLDGEGPNYSHRHVTVSTSGLVPQIRRLGAETQVKLAVSLNATTDEQRDRLMPINRRYPLSQLLAACRAFPMKQGRRITFEYVLLAGVNDGLDDAERLARLIDGIPAKVNLIPYNENPGLGFAAPPAGRVEAFHEALVRRHVTTVVRRNRGRDIAAACGQLVAEGGPGDPRRRRGGERRLASGAASGEWADGCLLDEPLRGCGPGCRPQGSSATRTR